MDKWQKSKLIDWLNQQNSAELTVRHVARRKSYLRAADGSSTTQLLPFHWEFLSAVTKALFGAKPQPVSYNEVRCIWDQIVGYNGRDKPSARTFKNYWEREVNERAFTTFGLNFSANAVHGGQKAFEWRVSYAHDPTSSRVNFRDVLKWEPGHLKMLVEFRRLWDDGAGSLKENMARDDLNRSYRIAFDLAWAHSVGRFEPRQLRQRLSDLRALLDEQPDALADADLRNAALKQWHRIMAVASRSGGEPEVELQPHIAAYLQLSGPGTPDAAIENLAANLERARFNKAKNEANDRRRLLPRTAGESVACSDEMAYRAEQSLSRGCRAVFLSAISDDQRTLSSALCNLGLAVSHFFEWGAFKDHGAIDLALRLIVSSHDIDRAMDQSRMEQVFLEEALCKTITLFPTWRAADDSLMSSQAPYRSWQKIGADCIWKNVARLDDKASGIGTDYGELLILMAYRSRLLGKFLGCFATGAGVARDHAREAISDKAERGQALCEVVEILARILACPSGSLSPAKEEWLSAHAREFLNAKADNLLAQAKDLNAADDRIIQEVIEVAKMNGAEKKDWKRVFSQAARRRSSA